MATPMDTILVIDDDRDLCDLLGEYLRPAGFKVETAHDGDQGIEKAMTGNFSIVILDVMLPGRHDGYGVLKWIRAHCNTPVLMLTALGDDVDRIVGLEMGADDYLSKPFNPRELLARIRAVLRRSSREAREIAAGMPSVHCRVGDVEMDAGTRAIALSGKPVDLTAVEFKLLEMLLFRAGQTVTREELTGAVLGRPLTPYDRSIDVHVSKLRKKLGPDRNGMERIKSVRGSGYIYVLPLSAGSLIHGPDGT
ncbi:MAG TPA: response regulator transcription factor [Syntrophales bacterium]|nr:response regulator transcription factor [Syntrophales bacterium]